VRFLREGIRNQIVALQLRLRQSEAVSDLIGSWGNWEVDSI
jgi:hypothetical protein